MDILEAVEGRESFSYHHNKPPITSTLGQQMITHHLK